MIRRPLQSFAITAFGALGAAAVFGVLPAQANAQSTVVAAEDAKLAPLDLRAPDGAAMALLWGDPANGPSAMLLRLPKGPIPVHVHSSTYHLMVLRGTMKHWDEAGTEAAARPLGPGSYWRQPGGMAHGDACLSEDCLVHLVWDGKRDAYRPAPKP